MIISHKHQFIFIKPRKVAGTSVEVALSKFCGLDDIITPNIKSSEADAEDYQDFARNHHGFFNHMSAELIAKKIGKKIWKKYFKFAIVRNPYDMVVSRYFWNKKNITPRAKPGAVWREIGQEPLAGHLYKKFIFSCYRSLFHKDLQPDDDFRTFVLKKLPGNISNNKYYFDKQGRPLNDLVIRYENLDEDYKKVCEKINIPYEPLPQLKTKTRQKNSYRELYDQELKNLITKKFKKEIEYFNYQF